MNDLATPSCVAWSSSVGHGKLNEDMTAELRRWLSASGRAVLQRMGAEERQAPQGLELVRHVADLLDSQASYDEAETLYREVLTARERTLGETDAKTLGAVQTLGASLMRAGKSPMGR